MAQLSLSRLCTLLLAILFLATQIAAADLSFAFDIERYTDYPDNIDIKSALQIKFQNYDAARDGTAFTFTVEDLTKNILFDTINVACHEDKYPVAIETADEGDEMKFTFDWPEVDPIPSDFICTIDSTNPREPTDSAQIAVKVGDAEATLYPLPRFTQYYDDEMHVSTFQLNTKCDYSFHILGDAKYVAGDKILVAFEADYGVQPNPEVTKCTDHNLKKHTIAFDQTSSTFTITLSADYEHDDAHNTKITCSFINPVAKSTKQYYATVHDEKKLYISYPLTLPTFDSFEITNVEIKPVSTKIGSLVDFIINLQITRYRPAKDDIFRFKTWFPVIENSVCKYGDTDQVVYIIPEKDEQKVQTAFFFHPNEDWETAFPDNNIHLVCSGAHVDKPHTASTGEFQLKTFYQSDYLEFTLPIFMNDYLILFSSTSMIPQATNVKASWSVYTALEKIETQTQLVLNTTLTMNIKSCTDVEFVQVNDETSMMKISAGKISKADPFTFTCLVNNELYEKQAESQMAYKLMSDTKILDQSSITIPPYLWPSTSQLAHQLTLTGVKPQLSDSEIKTLMATFAQMLKIDLATFFIGSYTTEVVSQFDEFDEFDEQDNATVYEANIYMVYLETSGLYPDQLDDHAEDIADALKAKGYGESVHISHSITTFEYPDHCLDGVINAFAESSIDCGSGRDPTWNRHSCKPCASGAVCFEHSQCLSQKCSYGECISTSSQNSSIPTFSNIVTAAALAIVALAFF